MIVALDLTQ